MGGAECSRSPHSEIGGSEMARDQVMTPAEPKMPRFTGWLRPVVDAVARVKAGVHRKLLFGFLIGALLLVAMALLSLLVIRQMNDRMVELDRCAGEGRPGAGDALRGDGPEPLPGDGTAAAERCRQVQRAGRGRQGDLRPTPGRAGAGRAGQRRVLRGRQDRQRGVPAVRPEGAGVDRPRPHGRGHCMST